MALITIHHIPNEVISQIFLQCSTEGLNIPWRLTQPPWVLSRVCSMWRQLAFNTHDLWSHLIIDCGGGFQEQSELSRLHRMVTGVLSRTGQVPLSLFLFDVGKGRGVHHWLRPHAHRVKAFGLFEAAVPFLQSLASAPLDFPRLETIEVGTPVSGEFQFSMITPGAALNLREVRLYSVGEVAAARPFLLPLSQLTAVEFDNSFLSVRDALKLLSGCRSLVECSLCIQGSPSAGGDGFPETHTTLPSLESLALNTLDHNMDLSPFRVLALPRLSRVEITGQVLKDMEWLVPVAAGGALENLTLESRGLSIPAVVLERVLETSPLLDTLRVGWGDMLSPAILQRMESGELVPKLWTLECLLADCVPERANLDLHLDVLERWRGEGGLPGSHCMAEVVFRAPANVVSLASGCPRLRRLREAGWEIRMVVNRGA